MVIVPRRTAGHGVVGVRVTQRCLGHTVANRSLLYGKPTVYGRCTVVGDTRRCTTGVLSVVVGSGRQELVYGRFVINWPESLITYGRQQYQTVYGRVQPGVYGRSVRL